MLKCRYKTMGLARLIRHVDCFMKTFLKSMCIFVLLLGAQCKADLILWTGPTDTTDVTNISTNGTLESAFNGGNSTVTANGVTFASSSVLGNTFAGVLGGGTSGDADFDTLLDEFTFGSGTGDVVLDIGNFVLGDTYEVQVFYTDQRPGGTSDRVMRFDDDGMGTNSFVDLESNPDNTIGSPFGQFAIGTFTSDGTDLNLILNAQGFGNAHITAWQIRNITAVPEPSSTILMFVLVFSGVRTRRRRASLC